MALVLKDRVKETTTTTGTGTITLAGASSGYQAFSAVGNGNTTYYTITDPVTGDWEVGIGTYTSSGTTLSRDTILSSSNAGSAVNFAAGTKDVFCVYPAEKAVYEDASNKVVQNSFVDLGVTGTATINAAALTTGTISTTPASNTDIANKQYVDTVASSGIHYHAPVRVESPTPLTATYNNGSSGVGATLTNAGTQVALVIDGVTVSVNDRVLIYTQTNATQNGIYTVTNVGSGSTNWVLTRATDADTFENASPTGLSEGSTVFVQQGATGAGETYTCNTVGTITFGTTNITFAQISSAQIYSAGTGLTLSGTQFSITNTGTAGTYGSATTVPVLTTNAQGQVTGVTNTSIAINANQVTAGTLAVARGGTGLGSYTTGDILYASASGTLAGLADVATGNVLLSGGAAADPSYGKVGLSTHVSGQLPTANGGTNLTSFTSGGAMYATSTSVLTTGTLPVTAGGTGVTTLSGIAFGNGTSAFSAASAAQIVSAIGSTAVTNATNATNATNTVNTGITEDTATATAVYPTWVTANTGNLPQKTTSTKFTFVPSTGVLSATQFSGSGAGLTSIPNAALTNSAVTVTAGTGLSGGGSVSLGGSVTLTNAGVTSFSAGTTGLTPSTGTTGAVTLAGTLAIANGGTGSTTNTGARTNLGATTLGSNLFTITNPSAVTFPRFNADNTVSALDAATFRSAIGAGTSSTTGTVTSVATGSGLTGGPITSTGTVSLATAYGDTVNPYGSKTANFVLAAPNGTAGVPTFRAIVAADIPTLNQNTTGNAATATTLQTARNINGTSFNGSADITVTANTTNTLTRGTYLTGSNFNGSAATTWAVDADTANTASKVVVRDGSGNFAAGTITATLSGNATNVTGTVAIANGGTGATTRQDAMDALAGAVTSGQYLRGNGTDVVMSAIQAADVPTLNQNTTGSAATFTSTTQNSQFNSVGVGTAGSGTAGEIRATNNITAYFSSDRKLKENIQDVDGALEKVCAIGSKTFDWTDEYLVAHGGEDGYFVQKSDFGVIAQDVKAVFPQAVRTREDGTLAVDYEKLATLAFGAIKELAKRVEALEAK